MSTSKRKFQNNSGADTDGFQTPFQRLEDHNYSAVAQLHIEAHEADLIHGQRDVAEKLVNVEHSTTPQGSNSKGSGLVRWICEGKSEDTWVDRYDARLLLTSLPAASMVASTEPASPSGWTDLSSDEDDFFFFTADEADDLRRIKRRRLLDQDREERLRNMRAQDGEVDGQDGDEETWGGSDEEPDEAQRELMKRTAIHIVTSPNPGQLEMRILANHGQDKRFAFLRGRWKAAWASEKARARRGGEEEKGKALEQSRAGLNSLTTYGESDDEGSESEKEVDTEPAKQQVWEESLKEMRRQKAREWSAKRRSTHT